MYLNLAITVPAYGYLQAQIWLHIYTRIFNVALIINDFEAFCWSHVVANELSEDVATHQWVNARKT